MHAKTRLSTPGPGPVINRGALLLRCRQPAVDWINAVDPGSGTRRLTLADANAELNVYLVADAALESPEAFRRWLKRNYRGLFELELEGWYADPATWPPDRSFALFCDWFDAERHSVVVDLAGGGIHDDEAAAPVVRLFR